MGARVYPARPCTREEALHLVQRAQRELDGAMLALEELRARGCTDGRTFWQVARRLLALRREQPWSGLVYAAEVALRGPMTTGARPGGPPKGQERLGENSSREREAATGGG